MELFDAALLLIFVVVQARVTLWLWRATIRRLARAAILAFNAILAAGYAFSFSEFLSMFHIPPRATMVLGAATLWYLLLATVLVLRHDIVSAVRRHFLADADPGRRRALAAAGSAIAAAPVIALGYGTFIERHNFRVNEIDLPLAGLAPALDGLRLLHLSDIHLSAFLSEAEFASVVDASNELRPRLAVVTGDLISSRGDPLDACLRQIARLKPEAGVFGCLGNHERYADAENYTAHAAARLGVRFLRRQSQPLSFGGSVLNLAGVDYQRKAFAAEDLSGAGQMVVPGALNVLLSHNPNVLPAAARQGYNLVLAGHTHGGQVTVEILSESINPARFFTPYVHGVYREGAAAAYVTRGIGTIGIPVRLGAPPEISLLRLRKA